jgi:hypothetical protein
MITVLWDVTQWTLALVHCRGTYFLCLLGREISNSENQDYPKSGVSLDGVRSSGTVRCATTVKNANLTLLILPDNVKHPDHG